MHRYTVSNQDIWKPDSIETIEFPSMIKRRCYYSGGLNVCEPKNP
jgi:hypothetical protein